MLGNSTELKPLHRLKTSLPTTVKPSGNTILVKPLYEKAVSLIVVSPAGKSILVKASHS